MLLGCAYLLILFDDCVKLTGAACRDVGFEIGEIQSGARNSYERRVHNPTRAAS